MTAGDTPAPDADDLPPFVEVVNWDKFQTYKARRPKWIKLYNSLLDDLDFLRLSREQRCDLITMWLFASKWDNCIQTDEVMLGEITHGGGPLLIRPLITAGFLRAVPGKLGDIRPTPSQPPPEPQDDAGKKEPRCPYEEIKKAWNDFAAEHGLPTVKTMTPARKAKVKSRWAEWGGIEQLQAILDKAAESPFLKGDRGWKITFNWLIHNTDNSVKILEGTYEATDELGGYKPI